MSAPSQPTGHGPDLGIYPATAALEQSTGELSIGGCDLSAVAEQYGTPALVVDEGGLRDRAQRFRSAFATRHPDSQVHFASKAFPSAAVLGLLAQEGLHLDVASGNELAIAVAGGADPARALLHGNAKADADLRFALQQGIGYVVIDNLDDIDRLARLADRVQPVLLRVTPGVDAATHAAVATGHAGAKFGVPVEQAVEVIARIRREPMLRLDGLHAHIGSQIFDLDQFRQEVAALATLERFPVYDVGGGLAARYLSREPAADIDAYAQVVVDAVHDFLGTDVRLIVEPGRSLVAPTAVSLYRVVTVKRGVRTHVAIDGGMGDNLEVSLYGQRFEPWRLGPAAPLETVDLVGHHCESGDVLVSDAVLPRAQVGDLVVVPVTGAYTYTMSNNYNAACRPPVLFCRDGRVRVAVRRETLQDLLAREMLLPGG